MYGDGINFDKSTLTAGSLTNLKVDDRRPTPEEKQVFLVQRSQLRLERAKKSTRKASEEASLSPEIEEHVRKLAMEDSVRKYDELDKIPSLSGPERRLAGLVFTEASYENLLNTHQDTFSQEKKRLDPIAQEMTQKLTADVQELGVEKVGSRLGNYITKAQKQEAAAEGFDGKLNPCSTRFCMKSLLKKPMNLV